MRGLCYWHVIITIVLCLGIPSNIVPHYDGNQFNVAAGKSTLCS